MTADKPTSRREAAYDAVHEVIRADPPRPGDPYDQATENARLWHAVNAALDVALSDQDDEKPGPAWCTDQTCTTARHGEHWHSGPPAVVEQRHAEAIARATEWLQAELANGRLFVDGRHSTSSAADATDRAVAEHVARADALHRGVAAVVDVRSPILEATGDDTLRAELDDQRAAYRTAAAAADRFRDVVCEVLGYDDDNPGDDVLVAKLRERHGKTGPEPTRWRDALVGYRAQVDQINAARGRPLIEAPAPLEPPPGAMVILEAPRAELVTYRRGLALEGWRPLDADPGVPAITWAELCARGRLVLLFEQDGPHRTPPPYPADLEPHLRLPERPACGDPEHRHTAPCRAYVPTRGRPPLHQPDRDAP